MVAVVGIAAAVVIVAGDSDEVTSTSSASPHQGRVPQPPSTRYDGGPEEGTRGAVSSGRPESAPLQQQEHPLRSRLGTTQAVGRRARPLGHRSERALLRLAAAQAPERWALSQATSSDRVDPQ